MHQAGPRAQRVPAGCSLTCHLTQVALAIACDGMWSQCWLTPSDAACARQPGPAVTRSWGLRGNTCNWLSWPYMHCPLPSPRLAFAIPIFGGQWFAAPLVYCCLFVLARKCTGLSIHLYRVLRTGFCSVGFPPEAASPSGPMLPHSPAGPTSHLSRSGDMPLSLACCVAGQCRCKRRWLHVIQRCVQQRLQQGTCNAGMIRAPLPPWILVAQLARALTVVRWPPCDDNDDGTHL